MIDAELVTRLNPNDDEAYREVVACFGDPLYGYIYSITGDHHLSEDVLSETYLRMVEKIDSYTFYGAPFKAWLYRIAHNLAINALKRTQRLVGADALETAGPPIDDPAVTIAARLESDELRAALTELTEEQQQVVLLRFVAEQSPAEVAQALDKTENAVKSCCAREKRDAPCSCSSPLGSERVTRRAVLVSTAAHASATRATGWRATRTR